MNVLYRDILERIPAQPLWWDEHAVPRYCEFSPQLVANIYAREAVLLLITTQNGLFIRFKVAVTSSKDDDYLADLIRFRTIGFGDPPRTLNGDEDAGAAEDSETLEVLQYWKLGPKSGWAREPSLEISFSNIRYENQPYTLR